MISLKELYKGTPDPIKIAIASGLAIIFILFMVFKAQDVWNNLGNKIFEWKIGKKQEEVKKDLAEAEKQKKLLEQSLQELKSAKEELNVAKTETDRLKGIFNDSSKTSTQKVVEFKKAIADEPVHTATDNITTQDLCERARAIGASTATIIALCGQ